MVQQCYFSGKKDGSRRFVVDYRGLNAVTRLTHYRIPLVPDMIDSIAAAKPKLFASIDLKCGYWQVEMDPLSAEETAFSTHEGTFMFKRLAFGLTGAPIMFQRLMDKVLRGLTPSTCLVYLDDVLVMGSDPDDLLIKLDEVFARFRQANLRVNPAKSFYGLNQVKFIGLILSASGVAPDPAKFQIVRDFPTATTPNQVRSFIGLVGFYRKFIRSFSQIAAPLYGLLKSRRHFNGRPTAR